MWRLSPVLVAVGCGSSSPTPCIPGTLVATSIADEATEVAVDTVLEVTVDGGDGAPEVWVDGGGTPGWVDASAPVPLTLAAGRTHTARVEQCGVELGAVSFETLPEPKGELWAGPTWAVDLRDLDATWTRPSSRPPDAVSSGFVGDASLLLLHVTLEESPRLHVAFGEQVADTVLQFTCATPSSVSADLTGDPLLSVGPEDLVLEEGDAAYAFRDLELTATATGERLTDVTLRFGLDLRLLPGDPGTTVCTTLASYGAECAPCPDQDPSTDDPACLEMELTWPEAVVIPELQFALDPAEDPSC